MKRAGSAVGVLLVGSVLRVWVAHERAYRRARRAVYGR